MSDEDVQSGTPRVWRRPALVGGAVVLVGAAVVGSFAVGRATAPGPAIVVAAGPVVAQSPAASSLPVSGVTDTRPVLEVDGQGAAAPPAVFTAGESLPNTPTTASGYALSRGQTSGPELAVALAGEFGAVGERVQTADGWLVGPPDGSTPTLRVNDDALLSWNYHDPQAAARATAGVSLSGDRAQSLASALLAGVGVDVGSVDWQIDRYADRVQATAWQKVDGARTHLSWVIDFGQDGAVVDASGFAAGLVEIPGYPVIGAASAVRRASLPTWAALGPTPLLGGSVPTPSPSASAASPQATGRPVLNVPMAGIVVDQATLGLAQYRQPDGGLLILPSYVLTGDDGSRWTLIAVSGEDVRFVDVPYPTALPSPS